MLVRLGTLTRPSAAAASARGWSGGFRSRPLRDRHGNYWTDRRNSRGRNRRRRRAFLARPTERRCGRAGSAPAADCDASWALAALGCVSIRPQSKLSLNIALDRYGTFPHFTRRKSRRYDSTRREPVELHEFSLATGNDEVAPSQ